jgi:MFS family permease
MALTVIFSALAGAIVGFMAVGLGAASVLVKALGDRDGGSSMAGFFGFGPIGAIAGALLGAGLVLQFGGGSSGWAKGLMVSSGALTVLTGLVLIVSASPKRGPSYSNVIEFQLEYPSATLAEITIPSQQAMWGAGGGNLDAAIISQFFQKQCEKDVCILDGSIAALGPMDNFRVPVRLGTQTFKYVLDLPIVPTPVDWSPWKAGEGARVRWRIVAR